eukprot:g26595.t1
MMTSCCGVPHMRRHPFYIYCFNSFQNLELKWKVLVKGKRIGKLADCLNGQGEDHDTGEVTDEDEAAEMDDENIRNEVKKKGK